MTVAPALEQVERSTARVTHSTDGPRRALGGVRLPCTRRVSAGIRPAAGLTGRQPSWWGAQDWTELEVPAAVWSHRDLCRAHHVDPDTVVAVARGMARYADHRTGRDCRPTNARLVEVLRLSLSTVQRARRVLKALGLVVELVAGRSMMTRAERLAAWKRGSAHRQIAAEFALCSRRQRPRVVRPVSTGQPPAVERDTPPGAHEVSSLAYLISTRPRRQAEPRRAAPRPAAAREARRRRPGQPDPTTRRLAEAARRRLPWLSGVSARRIAPALHRFAQAGWDVDDLERAVADGLATRGGWRVPRELRQPAAYLAALLRPLDTEDRPSALDEHLAAWEAAQAAYARALRYGPHQGPLCPHGQPAGAVPSPVHGRLACPACRADAGH
jgi:DNA-binding transcriptional ArsR family regulator